MAWNWTTPFKNKLNNSTHKTIIYNTLKTKTKKTTKMGIHVNTQFEAEFKVHGHT